MTDKPCTFDIKFDSAGDFDKARELIERMNATLAAKEAQIDRVRALVQEGCELVESAYSHVSHGGPTREEAIAWTKKARAALGEPAATPEREQP